MKPTFLLLAIALSSLLGAPTVRANLIINGGFETGNFSGWTLNNGTYAYTHVSLGGRGGPLDYADYSGGLYSMDWISQTIGTTVGASYLIRLYLDSPGGSITEFKVLFGQTQLVDSWDMGNSGGWKLFEWTATASTTSTPLAIGLRHDPSHFRLDDISVEAITAVPEPGSLLALGCLIGSGVCLRYRRCCA